MYLHELPRVYAIVWLSVLVGAIAYVERVPFTGWQEAFLIVSVGIASAVAVCTAHELMHRRVFVDRFIARWMNALCLYGHMDVEHLHHHATIGDIRAGGTAPRGMSVYTFAAFDWVQGLRNAWSVETSRLRRANSHWWKNEVLRTYALATAIVAAMGMGFGAKGLILFFGQAIFAVFVFEVITYVHHYGLVVTKGETPGPRHSWAHHCWITNCLTFNNTYHGDHHARPGVPYYQLHAMAGVPRLPASYFTMFCVALIPPLWFRVMDRRLDTIAETDLTRHEADELFLQRCR
jgi:alkane 1-monooxygenase